MRKEHEKNGRIQDLRGWGHNVWPIYILNVIEY